MFKNRNLVIAAIISLCLTLGPARVMSKHPQSPLDNTAAQIPGAAGVSQQPEEPLFQIWDARGKEGFMDARGNIVIAPQFDNVTSFREGLAPVANGDKWGYIDRTGKLVIPMQWRAAGLFSEGVAAVVDGYHGYRKEDYTLTLTSCGFIDKRGRYVIEPSIERGLERCPTFSEGLASVCYAAGLKYFFPDFAHAGYCGYLDKSGRWAIKPQYVRTSHYNVPANFSEGLAPVALRGSIDPATTIWKGDFAYIDRTGRIIFELKDYYQAYPFREGLARVVRLRTWIEGGLVKGETTTEFIDNRGRLMFKFETEEAYDFFEGRARVKDPRTKRYGYVDKSGNWAIPPKYAAAANFSDGLASVCTEEQSGCAYIDTRGRVILKAEGRDAFHDGLALQYLFTRTISEKPDHRNIYGYMNKSGKYVWVSPGGEYVFNEKWWRENYVGPRAPRMPGRR